MKGREEKNKSYEDTKDIFYNLNYDSTSPHVPSFPFQPSDIKKNNKKYTVGKIIRSYIFDPYKYYVMDFNENNNKKDKNRTVLEKNTNESLDKAIETANLYLDLYKNDLDDQFMKMTGRLVKFKMKKKEWDEAKKNIDIILNYYKDNNNIPDWVKILENEFNNGNVIAKEKKCKKIKKSIQDLYVNEEYFEWRNSLQKKELDEYIFNLNNNLNFRYNYFNKVK